MVETMERALTVVLLILALVVCFGAAALFYIFVRNPYRNRRKARKWPRQRD